MKKRRENNSLHEKDKKLNNITFPKINPPSRNIFNNIIPSPTNNLQFPKKWFPNSTGRDVPMTSRFGIENNLKVPLPIITDKKNTILPKIIKSPIESIKNSPIGRTIKKWFPNSTGRDVPMTSKFGIENNHKIAHLRPIELIIPEENMIKVKIIPISPIVRKLDAPLPKKKIGRLWGTSFHELQKTKEK